MMQRCTIKPQGATTKEPTSARQLTQSLRLEQYHVISVVPKQSSTLDTAGKDCPEKTGGLE